MSRMSNFAAQQDGEVEGHPRHCVEYFCQFIVQENAWGSDECSYPSSAFSIGIALDFTPRITMHLSSSSQTT